MSKVQSNTLTVWPVSSGAKTSLHEEGGNLDRLGLMLLQDVQEATHGASRVNDVFHNQNIAASKVTQVIPSNDTDLPCRVLILHSSLWKWLKE